MFDDLRENQFACIHGYAPRVCYHENGGYPNFLQVVFMLHDQFHMVFQYVKLNPPLNVGTLLIAIIIDIHLQQLAVMMIISGN